MMSPRRKKVRHSPKLTPSNTAQLERVLFRRNASETNTFTLRKTKLSSLTRRSMSTLSTSFHLSYRRPFYALFPPSLSSCLPHTRSGSWFRSQIRLQLYKDDPAALSQRHNRSVRVLPR